MIEIRPILLCGGSGTRLWPVSREDYPKQFVRFKSARKGETTLFNLAMSRLTELDGKEQVKILEPIIVSSKDHRFLIKDCLKIDEKAEILLEPSKRNTAPALTLAALHDVENDSILAVFPSDHILDTEELHRAIFKALPDCILKKIVLIGIKPSYPETGYGYIKVKKIAGDSFKVDSFIEKPEKRVAEELISEGYSYWNSGIFLMKSSVWLDSLRKIRNDIYEKTKKAYERKMRISKTEFLIDEESYSEVPSESIDYAVIEHCIPNNVELTMIPFDAKWSDLGSWKSVFLELPKDENGNTFHGNVLVDDCKNSLVYGEKKLISVLGLSNVVVIDTNDSLLVSSLNSSQDVKNLRKEIEKRGYSQAKENLIGRRPWGHYCVIDEGYGFKIKRIVVKPNSKLSLQRHKFRAEHWTVIKGSATVRINESIFERKEQESIDIPKGALHRLINNGTEDLIIIEIQSGSYLGEDDIERVEDEYGRS